MNEKLGMATSKETIAARKELEAASAYLDRFTDAKKFEEQKELLQFAAQRIARARELDPAAEVTVGGPKAPRTYTPDTLGALALFFEGMLYKSTYPANALKALEKAVSLNPYSTGMHAQLAEVYVILYRRDDGLRAARRALELDETNFDAQRIVDKLVANPSIGVRPSILVRAPGLFIGGGIVVAIVGFFMWIASSPFGVMLMIVGGVGFAMGWFVEGHNKTLDAFETTTGKHPRKL